jgi:hypothetical protein
MYGLKISISLSRLQNHRPNIQTRPALASRIQETDKKIRSLTNFIYSYHSANDVKRGNTLKVVDLVKYFKDANTIGF